jgi:hypothetical protein
MGYKYMYILKRFTQIVVTSLERAASVHEYKIWICAGVLERVVQFPEVLYDERLIYPIDVGYT